MPPVPTLREEPVQIGVPRYPTQNGVAQGLYKAFGALGDIAADMKQRDDALWFSQAQADLITKSDELKDSVQQAEPDPTKRVLAYQQQQQKLQQDILKTAPSRDAQIKAQGHFLKLGAEDFITYKGQQVKQWNDSQMANLDLQGRLYASMIASEPDQKKRDLYFKTYQGLSYATTVGRHPAQTLDQHTKRMLAFTSQAEELRLNSIDPDRAISQIQDGTAVRNGLDPNKIPEINRSLAAVARRKDAEEEKTTRMHQQALFQTMANQADAGKLDLSLVNAAQDALAVSPYQADNLRGRIGKPGMQLQPGVAQDIIGDVIRNNWNPRTMNDAQNQLSALSAKYPRDPSITGALNTLDARKRLMQDRAHTDRARAAQQAILEFDTGPAARYRAYGSFFRQKFDQAKDALHLKILQGMDPAKALKEANDSITSGNRPSDADARDQLEQDTR